jgi:MscS family membrane protein
VSVATRSATLALLATLVASASYAQSPTTTAPALVVTTTAAPATTTTAVSSEEEETADLGFTSPRSTMRGFLAKAKAGDWAKAAEHLDLRRIPRAHRDVTGPLFARQLKTVLDRTIWIDFDELSDSPDGLRDDGLPARRDLVGTIKTSKGNVDVAAERVPEADGALAWKIAGSVTARIPELYAEFGDGPLANFLPDFLLEVGVFELRLWQWLALALLLATGAALAWLLTVPLLRLLAVVVPEDRRHQGTRLLSGIAGPLRSIVVIAAVTAATPWLALSVPAATGLALLRKTATTMALTWLGLRVVDVVAALADDRLRIHGRAGAVSVIPLGRRTVKIIVALMAGIVVVQNLGYDATGILAGLGVGGLALALAAQKTVENLFGGVMLITDQPVRVGDLCRFGSRTGIVEDIGLRSTRVRTPERSIVSIPNAEFASTQIENLTLRDRMQLWTTLGLRLETTTAQLRAVLQAIGAILEASARVERETTSVRFIGISTASLDVEISAYVLTREWTEFLAIREDLYLQMLDAIDAAGARLTGRPAGPPRTP